MDKLLLVLAGFVGGGVFVYFFFRANAQKKAKVDNFVNDVKKKL